jgi:hypothetical protein
VLGCDQGIPSLQGVYATAVPAHRRSIDSVFGKKAGRRALQRDHLRSERQQAMDEFDRDFAGPTNVLPPDVRLVDRGW